MLRGDMKDRYEITAKIWLYPGASGWHFITIPPETSAQIKALYAGLTRGWGSLRVTATLGPVSWATSIFPDKKMGTYLLPVKGDVRKKTGVSAGDAVTVLLEI